MQRWEWVPPAWRVEESPSLLLVCVQTPVMELSEAGTPERPRPLCFSKGMEIVGWSRKVLKWTAVAGTRILFLCCSASPWRAVLPSGDTWQCLKTFFFFEAFWGFFFFFEGGGTSAVYGSSQAKGWISPITASLRHSHTATWDLSPVWTFNAAHATLALQPTDRGQGLNPHPHGYQLGS